MSIEVFAQGTFLRQFESADPIEEYKTFRSNKNPSLGYCTLSKVYDGEYPNDSLRVVHRYDKCDNLLWSRLLMYSSSCRTPFSSFGFSREQLLAMTEDGGVIFGAAGLMCDVSFKLLLVKLDLNGNLVFNKLIHFDAKTENLTGSIGIRSISNGDFYLFGTSNQGTFVYRLNTNFNVIWGKIYDYDLFNHILTNDEGLFLYNETKMLRINGNGNILWSRVFSSNFKIYNAIEAVDGFVLVDASGNHNVTPADQDYMNLIKITSDGSLAWQNDPFWNSKDYNYRLVRDVFMTSIKNELFISATYAHRLGGEKFIINRLSAKGEVLQSNVLSSEIDNKRWYLKGMINHPVSGLLLFGYNVSVSSTTNDEPGNFICRMDDELFVNNCFFEPFNAKVDTSIEKAIIIDGIEDVTDVTLNSISDFPIQITAISVKLSQVCSLENQIGLSNDTTLCFGKHFVLKSQNKFDTYQWSTGETTRSIIVFKPGKYFVTAKNSCEEVSDTIVVNYHPDPKISFLVEPLAASIFEDVHFTSNTLTPGKVSWRIGVGYPIDEDEFSYQYPLNGIYNIKYVFTDDFGCRFTDSTDLKIYTLNISIPNTFTPNGDNLNETFAPVGFGVKSFKMTIFNRWGGIAYEGYGPWDGGEAPSGVYVYQMEITDDFNEVKKETGKVLLNR